MVLYCYINTMASISSRILTAFLVVSGSILLVVGVIGLLLPVIPGFVFLIGGAYVISAAWKRYRATVEKGGLQ